MAALYHPDLPLRTEALLAIRRMDDPVFDEIVFDRFVERYTNVRVLLLRDGMEEYRSTLGWTISAMGKRSLPRIQKALDEGYASDKLRERFSWIIGHLISKGTLVVKEDPLAAKLLRRLLKDPSELVRVRAAGSLGRGGLTDGYPVALAGLSADDGFTRMTAAWALGFIGIEEGVQKAAEVAMEGTDDLDRLVQGEAIHALGNLAKKTTNVKLKHKIVEHVMPLLSSSDTGIRLRAIVALWKAEHKPAALRLAELLLKDPDVRIRRQAARGLAKLSVPATIPFLLEALDDPHREVRKWVVNAFRTLETDEATTARLRERLAEEPDKRICEILRGILEKKEGKTVIVGRQRL
jgi:HEAT repeat protein